MTIWRLNSCLESPVLALTTLYPIYIDIRLIAVACRGIFHFSMGRSMHGVLKASSLSNS